MDFFSPLKSVALIVGVLLVVAVGASAQEAPSGVSRGDDASTRDSVRRKGVAVPNGALMIVGGGITPSLRRRFAELAGGADAKIVCVPTALPHGRRSGWCRRFFRQAGVPKSNRTVLHTRNPEKADRASFARPLRTADAVWFTGGRQWRLVEAYAGTRTLAAFHDVLERGGVVGGTSAGASIQGSFLIRGDPKSKTIVVGKYTEGFGFLPGAAIDQHLRARNRENDLVGVIKERPDLLGLGIDEGTAAVVQGDTLRVVGDGLVAVYDAKRIHRTRPQRRARTASSQKTPYFFLQPGDRLNLRTRVPFSKSAAKTQETGQ